MSDWLARTAWKQIRDRIQLLLMTLADMLSAGQCAEIVDKKMILHRVHREKTYCVDNGSLSIGRDNLYQSYHEEHGIWVEDQGAIK